MIVQLLKQIWNRRRQNAWVLLELFIVYFVMWFLIDFIGTIAYTYVPDMGYNIEHVYVLEMDIDDSMEVDTLQTNGERMLEIANRLSRFPEIETVGLSKKGLPMSGNNYWDQLRYNDSIGTRIRILEVNPDWMDVFRFTFKEKDRNFREMQSPMGHVALSEAAYQDFIDKHKNAGLVFDRNHRFTYDDNRKEAVIYAVVNNFREHRLQTAAQWMFIPLTEDVIASHTGYPFSFRITIRVRPEADGPDFTERFMEQHGDYLGIDQIFAVNLKPYSELEDYYALLNGKKKQAQLYIILTVFLLVNVFLGLIGTFWFRTRQRRAEMGLRIALGSSTRSIGRFLYMEGWLLLTIAAIPAAFLCYQVGHSQLSVGGWQFVSTWPVKWSFIRFLLGVLATYLMIGLIIMLGIWYPARQAMKVQPAEALHEE